MGLPAGGEGREVFRLELANEVEFYFRLFCECIWLSSVIRTMTQLFTHESIGIVSVVRSFGDSLIRFKIASPRKIWPIIRATAVCGSPDSQASRYAPSLKRFHSIAPTQKDSPDLASAFAEFISYHEDTIDRDSSTFWNFRQFQTQRWMKRTVP